MKMDKLLKQAQKMQAQMMLAQEELEKTVVEGTSGGGMVKVTVNGNGEPQKISISPEVVDSNQIEMLEDLILTAFNDAITKSKTMAENKMNSVSGGMTSGFPGIF
ncbi:MAG: YbaB/EbfC family nucleoid-associated protein [Synergistaceae bacterium]